MAWSEKAVADGVKAWLESDPSMTNEYVIMQILDAAAAVDGDAQWNAAIEVIAESFLRKKTITRRDNMMSQYPSEWEEEVMVWPDGKNIAAAIRSLKRG